MAGERNRSGVDRRAAIPDVDITTSIRARALRFGAVPETKVWFSGEPGALSRSDSEREGLPDEAEPGVTYRDVRVNWSAAARILHPTDTADDPEEDSDQEG